MVDDKAQCNNTTSYKQQTDNTMRLPNDLRIGYQKNVRYVVIIFCQIHYNLRGDSHFKPKTVVRPYEVYNGYSYALWRRIFSE